MLPQRRRPVHTHLRFPLDRTPIVFVTVCTKDRKQILARDEIHRLLLDTWRKADRWLIGRYVIMPDHLHLFCAPASYEPCSLKNWIAYWKSISSRRWPRREELPVWQTDFWDRQLRSGEGYAGKWDYVRWNPVRHGLVVHPDRWPYQGEMHELRWD